LLTFVANQEGVWKYLYRAVDRDGKTIDFLLTAKRDKAAAKRFFDKAMQANGVSEKVTMDKSGANKAAIDEINAYSTETGHSVHGKLDSRSVATRGLFFTPDLRV